MAQWLLFRPKGACETTERQVAEVLGKLPDTWIIRWGFLYDREGDGAGEHEGDFLICGPSGHVLVLEVKGRRARNFVVTGRWEGEEAGENPWHQLHAQWNWARRRLEAVSRGREIPFVQRALALPFIHFVEGDRFLGEVPREHVLGADELARFTHWWESRVATVHLLESPEDARGMFLEAFAEGLRPRALRAFLQETERMFERRGAEAARLLGLLEENPRLLVRGGAGSGKTLLALEQARRHAAAGRRTLLLCYNLALAAHLRTEASRLVPAGLPLTVLSWEELTGRLLAHAGFAHEPPSIKEARLEYYEITVPGYLLDILDASPPEPWFDALVVDEAQDHDTSFPAALGRPELPGWWHFYLRLLTKGAPVAAFYDPAQRPAFRRPDGFSTERLRETLAGCALVTLPGIHRYTRPVFDYLRTLRPTAARPLVDQLGEPEHDLPEGPEVEKYEARSPSEVAAAVADIARRWEAIGFCKPADIVVIGRRSELAASSLQAAAATGIITIQPFDIGPGVQGMRYLSVNRAKGLDFLAVIVIDLPRPGGGEPEREESVFMAASRARQLLALIHLTSPVIA